MAYDGWIEYNGVELVNTARTIQLARSMGVHSVRTRPETVAWMQDEIGGSAFGEGEFGIGGFGGGADITAAPWYDPGYEPSTEFAGVISLGFVGLDDSTRNSSVIEYTGDGGHANSPRNSTLPVVANVVIVAKTERGAEFGKRWLDRVLSSRDSNIFCSGADLRYYRYGSEGAPLVHRRDVSLTRGTSVTRKRHGSCSALWFVTFTMTAVDSYEYGEEEPRVASLGGVAAAPTGAPALVSQGNLVLVEATCPQFDYSPIYDPLYPALVASPTAPDFYPDGWDIVPGMTFQRSWVRVAPVEPTYLLAVPVITLESTVEARMVRVSIWPADSATNDQCDPLFSAVVTYLPAGQKFYIDGEQKAAYIWDGVSPSVRRTDSLVYAPDAQPVEWTAFNDHQNLLVTLDVLADSDGYEGNGFVRAGLSLVPKSD